ncbi:MAG: hypothetical protein KGO50_15775 [Myxococcales bacterium]|nr:hypothetical protein [Myxococcales bacterium]
MTHQDMAVFEDLDAASVRVFDCFTFFNELDLLRFRLNYLQEVVDYFVIVEATLTHSGEVKPLYLDQIWDSLGPVREKMIRVVVEDLPPPDPDRWVPEQFQRNAIMRGLMDAHPNDLVIISDADEIPSADVVRKLRASPVVAATLEMPVCYWAANWTLSRPWTLVKAIRRSEMVLPEHTRQTACDTIIADGGLHASYLMAPESVSAKFGAFAHDEHDTARSKDRLRLECLRAARATPSDCEPLAVIPSTRLNAVQTEMRGFRSDWFDFESPSSALRRFAIRWLRSARRRLFPLPLVRVVDKLLLIGLMCSLRRGRRR